MSLARNIKIELEIHVITCPGVWLCQNNGHIELSITALGYHFKAIPQPPRFPLCYHERFVMDGYFSDVHSVSDMEKALDDEEMIFTLWQKGRRLAYYSNKIGVILNYTGCLKNNFARTDNAIIMTRGSCFPGTLSPKIEYTASIQYKTKCLKCNRSAVSQYHGRVMKNLYENGAAKLNTSFFHQRPVCHAKQRHRWKHTENKIPANSHNVAPIIMRNCNEENESILCDYCLNTKDIGNHALYAGNNYVYSRVNRNNDKINAVTQLTNCEHVSNVRDGESFHSEDKCTICLKYASLFNVSNQINVCTNF